MRCTLPTAALGALLLSSACAARAPAPPAAAEATAAPTEGQLARARSRAAAVEGVGDPALQELLAEHWEHSLARWPTEATRLGDHRFDERLSDRSAEAVHRDLAWARLWRARAERIGEGELSEADRLTLDLFVEELEQGLRTEVCRFHEWSLSPRYNVVTELGYLPELHKGEAPLERHRLRARLAELPRVVDQELENLRTGLAAGRTANAASTGLVLEMVRTQLAAPTEEWPGVAGYEEDAAHLAVVRPLVEEQLRPALARYAAFLEEELLPAARGPEAPGLSGLPGGQACYAALVRSYTTLDTTAEERHALGLAELEGIHAEMAEILAEELPGLSLAEAFAEIRSDPARHFLTEDEVEAAAVDALARARAAMPEAFGRLPQADCVVRRVPEYEAAYTTIAYYRPPHADGSKPGEYFVNTAAPETRPRHEAEVLAFHEAIPGHHLQIAIAQELEAVPAFRKHLGMTAFVEGWALYSERLADEQGLYTGPMDRFGMLSFDSWRAARLVVDTGIHHLGWTREEAVAFMLENTPLAPNNIRNEVDRYITWPGQALAYKTGQVELRELRARAEADLGADFVLADFHDVVLGAGAVPLWALRARVEAWIAAGGGAPE